MILAAAFDPLTRHRLLTFHNDNTHYKSLPSQCLINQVMTYIMNYKTCTTGGLGIYAFDRLRRNLQIITMLD